MSLNVPATVYTPQDGHGEMSSTGVFNIVDTVGTFLTDTVGTFVVDTGITFTQIAATVWVEDGSL